MTILFHIEGHWRRASDVWRSALMINRIFMTFCLAAMTSASLHGDELSIKISLGIRDSKLVTTTNVAYPLAFRIENIGKAVVKEDQIPGLFLKGVIHILPKD